MDINIIIIISPITIIPFTYIFVKSFINTFLYVIIIVISCHISYINRI